MRCWLHAARQSCFTYSPKLLPILAAGQAGQCWWWAVCARLSRLLADVDSLDLPDSPSEAAQLTSNESACRIQITH